MSRATIAVVVALFSILLAGDQLRVIGFPDSVLAVVVIVAATRPRLEAVLLAAGSGLVEDALSSAAFGHRALPLACVAWLVSSVVQNLNTNSAGVRFCLVAAALAVLSVLEAGARAVASGGSVAVDSPGFAAFFVTAALAIVVWPVIRAAPKEKQRW